MKQSRLNETRIIMKRPHHCKRTNQTQMMKTMATYNYNMIIIVVQKETKGSQRNTNQVFRGNVRRRVPIFSSIDNGSSE